MSFQYFYPYHQFFYAQGVAVPSPSPNTHPLPAHPQPLTPATNLVQHQDSGYTSGLDLSNSSRGRSSAGASTSKSSSSAESDLSMITNGALPVVTSPPSGGYLPTLATSPSAPAPMFPTGIPAPFYTSTPYYAHNPAYMNALLPNGANAASTSKDGEKDRNSRGFQTATPPGPMVNHAMMHHMAYLTSLSGYHHPYPMPYPHPSTSIPQQAPLDLSSSEDSSPIKPFRKKLFSGKNTSTTTTHPDEDDKSKRNENQKKEEDKRNPFGINKILGVEASPVKTKIEMPIEEGFGQASLLPVSPAKFQSENTRKRTYSLTSSNDENHEGNDPDQAPKKKKCRDRPPLWGQEMPETIVTFIDCPEKAMFCDSMGKYQVPEIPEQHEEQQIMIAALLTLFKGSNLPPVPLSLRNNLFGLRFYPKMQTIFQASLYKDSRSIVTSYGGLAFDNFRAIDDNAVIDTMLKKKGNLYYCLTKKCIDPLGAQCTFTATSLGKMRRHVKNHLPDKKWVCAFCRTQMTDQTDMARHGTTHTLLRPFPCEMCGKVFSQKVTLTNHIQKTHNVATIKEISKDRYTCRQCGVHFRVDQREECIDHLKKYHYDKEYLSLKKRKRFPFRLSTDTF